MSTRLRIGLALGVLLLALGLHAAAALRYPLGSDPSLFQYHAWAMTQGVMPYRDSFEFNTPGIVLLHGGFTQLLGFSDAALIAVALTLSVVVVSIVAHGISVTPLMAAYERAMARRGAAR